MIIVTHNVKFEKSAKMSWMLALSKPYDNKFAHFVQKWWNWK